MFSLQQGQVDLRRQLVRTISFITFTTKFSRKVKYSQKACQITFTRRFEYFFQLVISALISEAINMTYFLHLAALSEAWKPSEGIIYFLLVIGAFLFAGVVLSIFTFYEDCYWGDESYRKLLKEGRKS